MRELEKTYDPKGFEKRIYEAWERDGDFGAEPDPAKRPFAIVMPPPNITGQLHMGHALDQTLQDVLTRWRRLQGYSALWLPGTDHASIATEVRVADEALRTEGKTKEELGRDGFLERAWAWKELYGGRITEQQRRLGASCDWSRERFTMDTGCNRAVNEFFVRLYEKGLIYRGNRMINWCPECGTSLSDAEVEHEDLEGLYWYFRYPAADGDGEIVVATSRPETMFGDTAVAVNPGDERYAHMVGRKVVLPLTGREIPVVADPHPDPEKGTGAVKITPAHDPNDFEVGQRCGLDKIVCIGFDAKMTEAAGEYAGMDRYECRKAWVAALDAAGYLAKTEKVVIPTGKCYRCGTVVEPMLSDQWFVSMKPLAGPAIEALKDGRLKFVPERYGKVYLRWMEEIRDWCISRQLWWGHRIPAWYCGACGEAVVAREAPGACPKCGAGALTQDEDVLDTWFSSGLWPFSTLGWPDETQDLSYFYPTDVLVTAYDIIFFWVARMVFSGLECMGGAPFPHVFIHGLVRAADGQKMSKSLNNGVDPLEVIDKYGADALRFMLLHGSAAGNDMRYSEDGVLAARNFANKLWNASRFVLMNIGAGDGSASGRSGECDEDVWIRALVGRVAREMTECLESYELSVATEKIYELIRDEFCDWYIELVKARLSGDDEASKLAARRTLADVLADLLRLLHPFMPFITEEIWSYLGKPGKLIRDAWPAGTPGVAAPNTAGASASETTDPAASASATAPVGEGLAPPAGGAETDAHCDGKRLCGQNASRAGQAPPLRTRNSQHLVGEGLAPPAPALVGEGLAPPAPNAGKASGPHPDAAAASSRIETLKGIIRAVRNIRAEAGTPPGKKIPVVIKADAKAGMEGIASAHIMNLAGVSQVTLTVDSAAVPQDAASAVLAGMVVYVPMDELVDYAAEAQRLEKEKTRLEDSIRALGAKLVNEGFTSKAPPHIVDGERAKLAAAQDALAKTVELLAKARGM